eukprot:174635_1
MNLRSKTYILSITSRLCSKKFDYINKFRGQLPHRKLIHESIKSHSNKSIKRYINKNQIKKDNTFEVISQYNIKSSSHQQIKVYHMYLNNINNLFRWAHHLNNLILYKNYHISLINMKKHQRSAIVKTKRYFR